MNNATPLFEETLVVYQEDQRAQARRDIGLQLRLDKARTIE
jgi:hypothetical protein